MAWHDPRAASAIWTGLGAVPVPPTDTGSSAAKSKAPARSSTRVPPPMRPSVRRRTTARAGSSPTFFRVASTASLMLGGDGAAVMVCMLGRPGGPGLPPSAPRPRPHRRGGGGGVDGGAADPGGPGAGAGRRLLAQRLRRGRPRPGVRRSPAGGDRPAGTGAGRVLLTGADVALSGRALVGDLLALAGGALAAAYVTVGGEVRQTVSTTLYTTICYSTAAAVLGLLCLGGGQALGGFDGRTWLC